MYSVKARCILLASLDVWRIKAMQNLRLGINEGEYLAISFT